MLNDYDEQMKIDVEGSHKEAQAAQIHEVKIALGNSDEEAQAALISAPSEISSIVTSPAALRGEEQEGIGESKDEGDFRRMRVFGSKFGVDGQELDEEATKLDKAWAVVGFLMDLGQRLVFIIPALLKGRKDNTLYLSIPF